MRDVWGAGKKISHVAKGVHPQGESMGRKGNVLDLDEVVGHACMLPSLQLFDGIAFFL